MISSSGLAQPVAAVDVAHERGHARAGLRHTLDLQPVARLRDGGEIGAIGHGADDFVEQMHDFGPRTLQLLDDLHARDEVLLLLLERIDLLDLLVELLDLALETHVAILLRVDQRAVVEVDAHGHQRRGNRRSAQRHQECELALLALLLAPGK
jgi:hypothetical protein